MSIYRWFSRFRGILVAPPLIFALTFFRGEIEADIIIWPIGISIFLLGLFLRVWAQEHLHYRLKIPMHLTTTGPYTFVRNPIYIGNTLMCVSVTLASEVVWLTLLTFFWCVGVYSFVIQDEEAVLLEEYGELYRKYVSEVPRWFPRSLSLRNLGLRNEHLRASVISEIHCLLLLLPCVLKEMVSQWLGY